MTPDAHAIDIVIPTIGRPSLVPLLTRLAAAECDALGKVIVVDDSGGGLVADRRRAPARTTVLRTKAGGGRPPPQRRMAALRCRVRRFPR